MKKPFNKGKSKPDIHQQVTDQVIAALEKGDRPWWPRAMWASAGVPSVPYNAVSGRAYRGYNHLALMGAAARMSGDQFDPRFCTFNQAKERGWHVRKGSKGIAVHFYRPYTVVKGGAEDPAPEKKPERILDRLEQKKKGLAVAKPSVPNADPAGSTRTIWLLRSFTVFHASQIEGIPELKSTPPGWDVGAAVDSMLGGMKASGMGFEGGSTDAAYDAMKDVTRMPAPEVFESILDYTHVLAHELGHATGHASRLNRPDVYADGETNRDVWAREELVAEMTSAMVCSQLGLTYDTTRHAQFVDDWIGLLRADKKLMLRASGLAAAAADHLLGMAPDLRAGITRHREVESGVEVAGDDSLDLSQIGAVDLDAGVADAIDWITELSVGDFEDLVGEADMMAKLPMAASM